MSAPEITVWCSRCLTYRALAQVSLCPVCQDDQAQKDKK